MRKKIGAAAFATLLTFGVGAPAFAQSTGGGSNQTQTANDNKDDSGKLGLVGLAGLLGLAGLARRDRGRDRGEYRTTASSR